MQRTDHDTMAVLRESASLEDEAFLQMDKLLALCAAQSALDFSDHSISEGHRTHYSLVMEEQAQTLRATLAKLLS